MATRTHLDSVDYRILAVLQRNAETLISDIAAHVGLSNSPCWRRIQRLKDAGVILRHVALLDASLVNLGVTVFVAIRTRSHTTLWFDSFLATVQTIPEVVEVYRVSGEVDYILRVVCSDARAYDKVYQRLTAHNDLLDVSSSFVLEQVHYTTELPLTHACSKVEAAHRHGFPQANL